MRGTTKLVSNVLTSILSTGGLISGALSNLQNEQIKAQNRRIDRKVDKIQSTLDGVTTTLDDMQSSLGAIAGMQVASLAVSVASIGVSAAGTGLVLRRLERLRDELRETGARLGAFHKEWQQAEVDRLIEPAMSSIERVRDASFHRNPVPVLQAAEEGLQHSFNAISSRIGRVYSGTDVPIDAVRVLIDSLAMTGAAQIKALFLLDEPNAARAKARGQADKIMQLTMQMPPDRLADRFRADATTAAEAAELNAGLLETGYRIASIPPLLDSLAAMELSPQDYLRKAEEETVEPVMFLRPGKSRADLT